jgi:hypothetical protein
MHTLRTQDRDQAMDHVVSFHGVPMFRGLAFAIDHIEDHGGRVVIASADRRVKSIEEHNRQFGTRLHAQQFLFDNQWKPGFNPANPPNRTSHCLFCDDRVAAVMRAHGHPRLRAGSKLPWYALGIDLSDRGTQEHPQHFIHVAHELGYNVVQPYSSGSERHHVIFVEGPIKTLEHWNRISKERAK